MALKLRSQQHPLGNCYQSQMRSKILLFYCGVFCSDVFFTCGKHICIHKPIVQKLRKQRFNNRWNFIPKHQQKLVCEFTIKQLFPEWMEVIVFLLNQLLFVYPFGLLNLSFTNRCPPADDVISIMITITVTQMKIKAKLPLCT